MPNNVIIVSNSNKESTPIDSKTILSDLGRPTKRGIKKCPSCGYLNGTRGYMCKNSLCNSIFKNTGKKKIIVDSVKLVTGTSRQIYSVRVRDKGPDKRGFVQLPIFDNGDNTVFSEVALCFVDSCQRLFDDSILKCHESESTKATTFCPHIEAALKSITVATALEFKHDLINNLNVEEDMKKKICSLAKSTDGPVVQRVTRNEMVVKCTVTPTNPLGYLHLIFYSSKDVDNEEDIDTFLCGCSDGLLQSEAGIKCPHYYAAVCAFASDSRFTTYFSTFIQVELDLLVFTGDDLNFSNMMDIENIPIMHKDSILDFSNEGQQGIEIEVLPADFLFESDKVQNDFISVPTKTKKIKNKEKNTERKILPKNSLDLANQIDLLSFSEWLSSVTERINSLIHYDFTNIEPLVFHIPTKFFDLLKDKIINGTKDQITTSSEAINRTEAPPFGQCMKTTYHILSSTHLKSIFNTAEVPLKIIKYFSQNPDGTFRESSRKTQDCSFIKSSGGSKGKYVAFIKIGNCSGEEEQSSVVIEWIGDLYEVSKFGELKMIFKTGKRIL